MKKNTAIIAASVLVCGTLYFALSGKTDSKTYEVYYAKKPLLAGTEVKKNQLEKKEVLRKESWMVSDYKEIKKMIPQETINPGRYIDKQDFQKNKPIIFKSNEGEYTIRTKTEYVNGGKIEPGDIVDVIFTGQRGEDDLKEMGEVKAKNLVVMSVRTQDGQNLEEPKSKDGKVPYAVTLKTTTEEATKLAWGQENGALSLFLKKSGGN